MTACHHFRGSLYVNHEPCLAKIDNFGKLGDLPCCVYGRGHCDEHTTSQPKVEASKMPGYVAGFDAFNEEE